MDIQHFINKNIFSLDLDIVSTFDSLDYVDIIQLIFSLEFQVTGCVSKSKDNLDFHIVAQLY